MLYSLELSVVGQSPALVQQVQSALAARNMVTAEPWVLEPGNPAADGPRKVPDALVLCIDAAWRGRFLEFIESLPHPRPLLFAFSDTTDVELLRDAMRAGIRDFFHPPVNGDAMAETILRFVREERVVRGTRDCRLITFMNTKGGSGASFIAANVAVAMVLKRRDAGRQRQLLLDYDFQFGGLPTYLNLTANDELIKVLEFVDTLDATALHGYVLKHDSGLHLLASAMDEIVLPEDIGPERIARLLELLDTSYDSVVIDLPHRIDGASASMLQHSDTIVLVAQQTVAHLHDTKRLVFLLHDRLGIAHDHMMLVINRYDKRAEVRRDDFVSTFPNVSVLTLPGDYQAASESINLGVPIAQSAPRSALGSALSRLAEHLTASAVPAAARPAEPRSGLFNWFKRPSR